MKYAHLYAPPPSSIIVATPTRLDRQLTSMPELKAHFRELEMLIVDEADRFADEEFSTRFVTRDAGSAVAIKVRLRFQHE